MSYSDYLAHLESPEWWATRQRAYQRAGYRCERCGGRGRLEAHHLSYKNLGAELDSEIEVLCDPCHRAERLPRNRQKRVYEENGQLRLFARWQSEGTDLEAVA